MSTVFRAVDAPPDAREDYWRQVIREQLGPLEVRLDAGPGVQDELIVGELGAVNVAESRTGPGRARSARPAAGQLDRDALQLFVEVDGVALGEQGDRANRLSPGDLSLLDLSRPFCCVYPAHRAVMVTFPRSLLPLSRHEVAALAGSRIPGDRGTPALVSTLVRRLPGLDDSEVAGTRLGVAVLDLLAAVLAARLERPNAVPPETRRRALVTRIEAYIDARLADPDLTPAVVAGAHHISLRYLHRLFEAESHGVARLIRQRRLHRCRADLLDPALADRPVAVTAARWGFADPAHFSRAFRDEYGHPPGEFRRTYAAAV
jgi:AraC-like DNA-binding protein